MKPNRTQVEFAIRAAALPHKLDPDLLIRQCKAESAFNQDAVSSCGAIGLFQLMPATAKELGVNPKVWQENIAGGIKYMAWLHRHYEGDYAKALAAYNWGVGRVDKLLKREPKNWRNHLPEETTNYLARILPPEPPDLPMAA
jgi:soluble lytic murein transglycosylase-like protein